MDLSSRLRVLGSDNPSPRVERATQSYQSSLRPPTAGRTGLYRSGRGQMQPLLDEVLGPEGVPHVHATPETSGAEVVLFTATGHDTTILD